MLGISRADFANFPDFHFGKFSRFSGEFFDRKTWKYLSLILQIGQISVFENLVVLAANFSDYQILVSNFKLSKLSYHHIITLANCERWERRGENPEKMRKSSFLAPMEAASPDDIYHTEKHKSSSSGI